ncbi:hypothetical protein C8R43DRAFT_353915 [Mycena crocata]|nr:hypothetical protein C8R43DRAFT_353915 [Mycena crocata]
MQFSADPAWLVSRHQTISRITQDRCVSLARPAVPGCLHIFKCAVMFFSKPPFLLTMSHSIPSVPESDSEDESAQKKSTVRCSVERTPPPRVPRFKLAALPDLADEYPEALAPKPPTHPQSGRPNHTQRGERNSSAATSSAQLTGLLPPHTPPPKKGSKQATKSNLGTAFSPHTSTILDFTTGLPLHLQASPERHKSRVHKTRGPRLGLNKLGHNTSKGWTSAGHATTTDAYKCFEKWRNDYSPQHYALAPCVDIVHAGNPLDRPKDIRARPVMFCWNTPDRRPPPELKDSRVPVFRTKFKCTGHCRHGNVSSAADSSSDSDSSDDDGDVEGEDVDEDLDEQGYVEIEEEEGSDVDDNPNSKVNPSTIDSTAELNQQLNKGASKKASKAKLRGHKCRVVLHAEVYSDDLTEIYFFQRYDHPEALEKYLDTSHYIRQAMLEMASLFNLPASSIKRRTFYFQASSIHRTDSLLSQAFL